MACHGTYTRNCGTYLINADLAVADSPLSARRRKAGWTVPSTTGPDAESDRTDKSLLVTGNHKLA